MSEPNSQMYSEVVETQVAEKQPMNPKIAPDEQGVMSPDGGEERHGGGVKVFGLFIVGVLLFGLAMAASYVIVSRMGNEEVGGVLGVQDVAGQEKGAGFGQEGVLNFRQITKADEPTLTPTPSEEPTPTPEELGLTPTITPVEVEASPTNRTVNPPVVSITYPTENQEVVLEQGQDFCVVDTAVGGDQTGMERRWKLNGGDWSGWGKMSSLCPNPNEGMNKIELQYKNSYGDESGVYKRNFSFHRVQKVNASFKNVFFENVTGGEGFDAGDIPIQGVKVTILNSDTAEAILLNQLTDASGAVDFLKEIKDIESLNIEVQVDLTGVAYTYQGGSLAVKDGNKKYSEYYILSGMNDFSRNKVVEEALKAE